MNRLDKLKADIDKMNAEEMAKALYKCNMDVRCNFCDFGKREDKYNCNENCSDNIQAYLEQEIRPSKTLAGVFFERNPEAKKHEHDIPSVCPVDAGLDVGLGCEENGLKTCELVERLAKKDGVKEEYAEPYQDKKITVNGPARIFIVTD